MKKRVAAFIALLICMLAAWLYFVTPSERAARARENQGVFDGIKKDTKWNMNSPMLYGYFFVSKHEFPLEVLGFILRMGGHRFVDIQKDQKTEKHWLHVEKIQVQNLDSISEKDVRLKRLGEIIFLSEYDGWDVGPDLTPTKAEK
jgi:cbb3-type cytochrome oxidase subunit 3